MNRIISCEFNLDTGCVELKFSDHSMISIYCTGVEDTMVENTTGPAFLPELLRLFLIPLIFP